MQVPQYQVIYCIGTPSLRLVVLASSGRCGHARAVQYTTLYRSKYSTLCYARVTEGGAGEEERRGDEGTRKGGAGEEERRRDERTRKRAKEVARTAGGKAAGARVIGG